MLITIPTFAQDYPRELTEKDYERIEQQINTGIDSLVILFEQNYYTDYEKEFIIDTFKIERTLVLVQKINYSTMGVSIALYDAQAGYDDLLNKYYKILVTILSEEDERVLRCAQRNWLRYRDGEYRLNVLLAEEKYSGGGTVQSVLVADRYLAITRQRVIELNNYLSRIWMDEN